jgi:PAS domain S-box-containing protein
LAKKNSVIQKFTTEELESLISSSLDVIFRISSTGKINFISQSVKELLGYDADQIIGSSMSSFVKPEKVSEYFKSISELFLKSSTITFNADLINKNEEVIPVEITGKVLIVNGEKMGQGTIRDNRKRLETQNRLASSENIFKAIWENSKDGMRLTDEDGIVTLCNNAFASLFDKNKDEIIGKSIATLYKPEFQDQVLNNYIKKFQQATISEYIENALLLWNSRRVYFEISNSFIEDFHGEKYLLCIFRDIGDRKVNENLIIKKGMLLQGIAKATNALITSTYDDEGFESALQILGESAQVDRVYIYRHMQDENTNEMYFTLIFEWVSEGIQLQKTDKSFQKLSYSRFAPLKFYESFSEGESLKFLVKDLPEENQKIFIDQSIKSIILVPILIDGVYWGFIGFDECHSDRIWTSDDESILSAMAGTFGEVIKMNGFREELIRKNMELDIALQESEKASKTRSDFLALMSHEIRTPMNGVIGMTGLLLESMLTESQKEYVNTIRLSGEQLLVIINDILDFTKIESEKLELENQPFDLRECIEDSMDLISSKVAEKDIELFYDIDDNTPFAITGDVTRLRQILTNLLSNAVKFTNKGEVEISVSATPLGHKDYQLHFTVKDTGMGIPEDKLDRLFKPFSQADSSTTRSFGGTGLGLVISKRLVEMMGGEIGLISKAGKGSTFYFSINTKSVSSDKKLYLFESSPALINKKLLIIDPNNSYASMLYNLTKRWQLDSEFITDIASLQHKLNLSPDYDLFIINTSGIYDRILEIINLIKTKCVKKNIGFVFLKQHGKLLSVQENDNYPLIRIIAKPIRRKQLHQALLSIVDIKSRYQQKKELPLEKISESAETIKLKILLVEDNNVNQMVAMKMLDRLGYRADIASNGKEAVDAIRNINYDLIFMDILMPEMDGLEACRIIKSDQALQKIPVIIAMTANAMSGDQENYLRAGMDDYISKPVNLDELRKMIETWHIKITKEKYEAMNRSIEELIDLKFIEEKNIAFLQDLSTEADLVFFKEMLDIYMKEIPKNIQLIRDAIFQNNADHLRFYIHKLKGSSLTLGIDCVLNEFKILENMALDNCINDESLKVFKELSGKMDMILEEIVLLKNKYSNIKLS